MDRPLRVVYWIDLLDVKEALDRLYASADFKKESYPVFSMDEKELAGANFHVFDTYSHIETGREELAELFRVYQEEFLQLTADERREEAPLGYIQFKTESMQNTIDQIRARKEIIPDLTTLLIIRYIQALNAQCRF